MQSTQQWQEEKNALRHLYSAQHHWPPCDCQGWWAYAMGIYHHGNCAWPLLLNVSPNPLLPGFPNHANLPVLYCIQNPYSPLVPLNEGVTQPLLNIHFFSVYTLFCAMGIDLPIVWLIPDVYIYPISFLESQTLHPTDNWTHLLRYLLLQTQQSHKPKLFSPLFLSPPSLLCYDTSI